ncbi:hypothetical protein REPUB_Repub02eG0206600 [Reevesia pubescens]
MVIFSKTLSETDIKKRCAVPMRCFKMKRFPKPKLQGNHMEDFVVKDENGHDWILCCSTRNIGQDPSHPKHPKPVLIKEWIAFVRKKKLCVGDRVIIYEEQDGTGSMHRRIKVERQTNTPEAHWSPVMNQNLDGIRGSTSHNSDNELTATFQPLGNLSADVLNHDLGGTPAVTISSTDKEQIPTPNSTSQNTACYKTERPSLSLSLELSLETAMTAGMSAATSSSIDKEQILTFHNTSQDIACYKTETPSLSMSLGLTLKPTMTGGQQYVYMQETEPKTIDFLGRF